MRELLSEILDELKQINKKLDTVAPSLDVDGVIDHLVKKIETTIHDKPEGDSL